MNKTQFKKYMINGLGRCVQVLETAPDKEKYRDIVLWGCTHELSLNTQDEGSRAEYVYRLTRCFDDPEPFISHTIAAFHSCPRTQDWRFFHICELLSYYAQDSAAARDALREKLDELYAVLCSDRKIKTYDYERDRFVDVAIALTSSEGRGAYRKICDMLDALYEKKPEYSPTYDFAWFYANAEDKFGKSAVKPEYLPHYPETLPMPAVSAAELIETAREGVVPVWMHIRFRRGAEPDEVSSIARYITETPDEAQKAGLLEVFRFAKWPLDCETLISYAKGENAELREAAYDALENCRSTAAHDLALELIGTGRDTLPALMILTANYTTQDRKLLLETLDRLRSDGDIHAAALAVLHGFQNKVRLPRESLMYIYNNCRCSSCRYEAVRKLGGHRWLTPELIEECRDDSYDETRNYVNRYYPKI